MHTNGNEDTTSPATGEVLKPCDLEGRDTADDSSLTALVESFGERIRRADAARKPARGWNPALSWKNTPGDDEDADPAVCGQKWSLRRPRTDAGNAERLAHLHGSFLRYVLERRRWLEWNGQRWVDGAASVITRAINTMRFLHGAADLLTGDDAARAREFARASESAPRLDAMIRLAASHSEVIVKAAQLDADPMLLNVPNGIIDLERGWLLPHQSEKLLTKLAPVPYAQGAPAPRWKQFLQEVLPDPEVRAFFKRVVGYTLTGSTREQVLFMLLGPGADGKSVAIETVREILGDDYARAADFSTFLEQKRETVRNDLARLAGARLVTGVEMAPKGQLAEGLVKQATGGDKMTARFLYAEHFEFYPAFKLWLVSNEKPRISGAGPSIWRRIRLIPFEVRIPKERQDPNLREKLRTELPGILSWAVEGCLEWQRNGLSPPERVVQAGEAYRDEMDMLGGFLSDCCVTTADMSVSVAEVYAAYIGYAQTSGETPVSKPELGRLLRERGFEQARTASQRVWKGISLRTLEP